MESGALVYHNRLAQAFCGWDCEQITGAGKTERGGEKVTEFFMAMVPPTVTHQEKQVNAVSGKPVFYEPAELKAARAKLTAHLFAHKPKKKYNTALALQVIWCFPCGKKHRQGEYRKTKPDTDNLQKLLKDCMTSAGFWDDDALVCKETVEKFWGDPPGIYIRIEELE
jgi:Holliday junction resolvase RusA-like endonuclease